MAFVRCTSGAKEKKNVLYKDGVWNVAYDNPGSYTFGSNPTSNFTIGVDSLIGDTSHYNVIGTHDKIDVTNYSLLHFKAKRITMAGDNCGYGCYTPSKTINTSDSTSRALFGSVADFVDYVVDVSAQTEVYIAVTCSASRACEVSEIYLT